MRKRILIIVAAVVVVLTAAGTVAAQSTQRFPDVPLEHEAYEAIEWAADVELTLGYDDGTFKPEQPLSKQHAVVFMERYYDQILRAAESPDFTRGDMMMLLHAIAQGTADDAPADTSGLLTDPFEGTQALPITSIWGVRIGGLSGGVQGTGARFMFQSVSAHSDRDLDKWPVRGWLSILCSDDPEQPGESAWFVVVNGQWDLPGGGQ